MIPFLVALRTSSAWAEWHRLRHKRTRYSGPFSGHVTVSSARDCSSSCPDVVVILLEVFGLITNIFKSHLPSNHLRFYPSKLIILQSPSLLRHPL
jgi:hypothetical protein